MSSTAAFCLRCGQRLVPRDESGAPRLACAAEGCGFVLYENPLPVVAAIVEREGKIVLVRGKGWPEKMYGLVTGFLEKGEAPEDGVLREVEEEIGLRGRVVELVGVYPFPSKNELIVAYHVIADGELRIGDELEDVKHVPIEKLRPWPFGTGLAVETWLAKRSETELASRGALKSER